MKIPGARISHIVRSKATAGREEDRLFLGIHAEARKTMLGNEVGSRRWR